MTLFDDLLAEAQALGLPTSPGGHPFPTAASPGQALWLALVAYARSLDVQDDRLDEFEAALEAGLGSVSQPVQRQVFTTSGTWTKPVGAKVCRIVVIGAGGSGSSTRSSTAPGSNYDQVLGGHGGARVERMLPATALPDTVPVTVGAAGLGAAQSTGGDGGHSGFGTLVLAGGGGRGGISTNSVAPPSNGGPGYPNRQQRDNRPRVYSTRDYLNARPLMDTLAVRGFGASAFAFSGQFQDPATVGPSAPEGGAAGGSLDRYGSQVVWNVRGGGLAQNHDWYTQTAITLELSAAITTAQTAPAGASRSGTGLCGDGGAPAAGQSTTAGAGVLRGGAGGTPGAGGGPAARLDTGADAIGGDGGRGEVIVEVWF